MVDLREQVGRNGRPVTDNTIEDAELVRSIALEEYKSIRSESKDTASLSPVQLAVTLAVFLGALPLITSAAFGAWIGEVERMERAGRYLRARERSIWPASAQGRQLGVEEAFRLLPALWENLLATRVRGYNKNALGAFASVLLFSGSFLGSEASGLAIARAHHFAPRLHWLQLAVQVTALIASGLFVAFFGSRLVRIRRGSRDPLSEQAIQQGAQQEYDSPAEKSVRTVDVVLPCWNEVQALPEVLSRVPEGYGVIVVDNGSSDGSAVVARDLGARVIEEPTRGIGRAVQTGVLASSADVVCVVDCDATVDLHYLPRLVGPIAAGRADLSIASRLVTPGSMSCPLRVANWGLGRLARNRGLLIHDLGSAHAYERSKVLAYFTRDLNNSWALEVALRALRDGLRPEDIPLPYYRRIGRSKITGTPVGFCTTVFAMLLTLFRLA